MLCFLFHIHTISKKNEYQFYALKKLNKTLFHYLRRSLFHWQSVFLNVCIKIMLYLGNLFLVRMISATAHFKTFRFACILTITKMCLMKWQYNGFFYFLKSDFNEVLFVLESGELLYKHIQITTICILKKDSTHKKYLDNNYFRVLCSGFIQMKVDTTLILAGCLDVTQYSLLRK